MSRGAASSQGLTARAGSRHLLPFGGIRLALLLVGVVILIGTAGYVVIEGWNAWDAFYMTITTVTTVGYREVHPLSRPGQLLTAFVVLAGVATLFYTASLSMALLVEGELHQRWQRRRRDRIMEHLSHHFIVCGFGRIGSVIADEFARQRIPFIVVDRDPDRARAAGAAGHVAIEGDASQEDVLKRVGVERARGLVAAVGTDAENVYTVLSARLLKPDLFIVGRAESDDARTKLKRAGADRVISPYHIGALQIAQTALRPAVVEFVQLVTGSSNLDLAMEQVRIEPGSALTGRTLIDANIRQRFGVVVVGIQRVDGSMEFNPPPEAQMRSGDHLVVLGRTANLRELEDTCAAAR
jgi:voltage-gated potassium channel